MVMSRERSSRPRARPASDDGQQLVDNTLKEIRKRHSSTYRLSSDEINQLLGDIRRSRSASEGRAGSRPPPPRGSPPPLPENSLPFGRSSKVELLYIDVYFLYKNSSYSFKIRLIIKVTPHAIFFLSILRKIFYSHKKRCQNKPDSF